MDPFKVSSFFSLESFAHKGLFERCAHVWEALQHLESYLRSFSLGKIEVEVPSSVTLVNASLISIAKGCKIEPNAYIEGPCIIGADSTIRHGAYIRGNVVTGDGCVIGHDTEIKNSIMLNRVCAAHFNYVGDSILGNEVNLGAGAKCANLRMDRKPILVFYQGKQWDTKRVKLGLIAGDFAQLGCNAVANPGTILGMRALVHPCLNVSGYIPANATVKPYQKNLVE